MVILDIRHEFIVLSDFDTDLHHLGRLDTALGHMDEDAGLMGCYFRMLPHEGAGSVFLFQQLEYCLQRSIYRFHREEKSIRVMPGAASCYRRDVLASIYHQHSGLRSGEDREATLIGLKMGYKTFYKNDILALTRPPLTFKALIKQRIRWNLGYLETFAKEKDYYFKEMARMTRVGVITISDILVVLFMTVLPLLLLGLALFDLRALTFFLAFVYACYVFWCFNCLLNSPTESREFKGKRIASVVVFPFFKIVLDYLSWMGAIIRMLKKKPARRKKGRNVYHDELFIHRFKYENTTHSSSNLEERVDPGGVRDDVTVLAKKTS
jgi:cellulose synthase/poly-beta-1,6-N-acetylglucosamine synthase-like glycosyltransferase